MCYGPARQVTRHEPKSMVTQTAFIKPSQGEQVRESRLCHDHAVSIGTVVAVREESSATLRMSDFA